MFDHFQITHDDMRINVDGDLTYFDLSLRNVDLTPLKGRLRPAVGEVDARRDVHARRERGRRPRTARRRDGRRSTAPAARAAPP